MHDLLDLAGRHVAFHDRIERTDGVPGKRFRWRLNGDTYGLDGLKVEDLPLFGSERLREFLPSERLFIVEGESATIALRERGFCAVGTVTGADGCPSVAVLARTTKGRTGEVVLWNDLDDAGRRHHDRIAERIPKGLLVRRFEWGTEQGDDARNFFERGGTPPEQLDRLLADEPEITKAGAPAPAGADVIDHDDVGDDFPLIVSAADFLREQDSAEAPLFGDGLLIDGGGYLVMGGEGGVGKTIVLASLFVNLAAGRSEFLGLKLAGRPTPVLVWEAEGSRSRFRARMQSLAASYGLELADLPVFFYWRGLEPSLDHLPPMIGKSKARAVLLDPIGRFHAEEENSASGWRRGVTGPLAALTLKFGAPFVFSDHYVKPSEFRTGRDKLRGSKAKLDDCGAALRLEYGKGGKASRVLFFDRVRDGEVPEPNKIALSIDVARPHVEVDPEGVAEAVSDDPSEQRRERQREQRSTDAQETIEIAFTRLEMTEGCDPRKGFSERAIAAAAEMSRNFAPFKDGIRALAAQGVIEAASGGWRRCQK